MDIRQNLPDSKESNSNQYFPGWLALIDMQNSKVLALKYRPKRLEDVIGQEIVCKTVFNSIKLNKIPNAFLFHGIRGTGKTSLARIIAKSLNCEKGIEDLCKDKLCDNCKEITSSNHLDVIEQDCATATGIDSVRDLIEFCRYPPSKGKYKVLILDEIQAMSKAGAQSLLKILEEPPSYVKFIFCTTEIKKILVTMISRCTRFDLSRVKSEKLFNYLKKIKEKENGNITDEALKLICKCSEGSVRDALSLLDRALISSTDKNEIDIIQAQKIFGRFDKSYSIELLKYILKGDEMESLKIYKNIYLSGVDPSIFLSEFLEIIYYIKNIKYITPGGFDFNLNDSEYADIKKLSKMVENSTLIYFWQFTINAINELSFVSNKNLSIEMFIIRLLYLNNNNDQVNLVNRNLPTQEKENNVPKNININDENNNLKNKPINQIKNITQKDHVKFEKKQKTYNYEIKSFEDLINICSSKKEINLKYELETNVNLIHFENCMIEISFNENLNKNFIKELSSKLSLWTGKRWIITLSDKIGNLSKKEVLKIDNKEKINNFKKSNDYKKILDAFDDAFLIENTDN